MVIELNPEYAKAHYNLNVLLREMDRKEEAEVEYQIALDLAPSLAEDE